jgi:protease I
MENIPGLRVAILITDGSGQVEMVKPREALDQAGAKTSAVSPKHPHARSWIFVEWVKCFPST